MAFPDDRLPIRLELAFGADPAGDPGAWSWADASDDVPQQSVSVRWGRSDSSSQVQPASAVLELDNPNGDYTPGHPAGAYYPHVRQGVPARLSVQAGGAYLRVPGDNASRARATSSPALDIAGDIDIRIEMALDAVPAQRPADHPEPYRAVAQDLLARSIPGTDDRMWWLFLDEHGVLRLRWWEDGTLASGHEARATVAVPYVSGQRWAARVTLDVDDGAGGWQAHFYTGESVSGPWVQLGDAVTGSGTTSIHTGAAIDLVLAEITGEAVGAGGYFAVQVRDGIDGPPVADADFTAQPVGTSAFVDGAGRTWLIEGAAEITDWRVLLQGTVDEWAPSWPYGDLSDPGDPAGRPGEARVSITIAGPLRRLTQGQKALESTLRRRVPSFDSVLAYWPMEDGATSTRLYSPIPGVTAARTRGMDLAADDSLAGSGPLPRIAEGASWHAMVPAPSSAQSGWQLDFVYYMAEPPAAGGIFRSLVWVHTTGTVRLWRIMYEDGPRCRVEGEDADGALVFGTNITLANSNVVDRWVRQQFVVEQVGGDVQWTIRWIRIGESGVVLSDSFAGSVGQVTAVSSPTRYHADLAGISLGQVGVISPIDLGVYAFADHGFDGETTVARMRRLAAEERLPLSVLGTDAESTPLGPQRPATLLQLLRECADADGGILSERRGAPGLQYRARAALYSQRPALELDAGASEIDHPFAPTLDDQRLRNDVTVSRTGGSSARVVDETSVAERGLYDDSITVNVSTDGQVEPIAWWRLHRGTWPGMRYPAVTTALDIAPDLIPGWLGVAEGDRAQVTGLPPQHPTGTVDLMVEGVTHTITPTRWRVEAATSPYGPWAIGAIGGDDPADDAAPTHVDTDGSALVAGVGSDDAAVIVRAHAGPEWVTSAGPAPTAAPGDLPFDVQVGGEHMTVSAVEPLAWDTFARTVASGWGSAPSTVGGAWQTAGGAAADRSVAGGQGLVALPDTATRFQFLAVGLTDCELTAAVTVPAVATGASLRAALLMRGAGADYYLVRLDLGTSGAVGLQVVQSGSVAATAPTGLTYTAGTVLWLRARVEGQTVRGAAWVDGQPRRGWQIEHEVTTGAVASGFIGCTAARAAGNTNASPAFAFDAFQIVTPQLFPVTRSVNGVVKSHAAGADVRLAHPAFPGL